MWVTVRGVQSGGAYFRLTNLMPCEPAIVLTDPHAGGIGDPVTLKAYGLPAELDKILVSFNGAVTHPESIRPDWDPELAYITVRVPEGATTGPLRLKRTDGVDRWSQPADFTVLEPTPLVLTSGDAADGIVVPVVTFDIGLPSEHTQEYGPAPWRLGGAYLTRIRASLDHPPGTLNLEVSTPNGTATTELMAAGDTVRSSTARPGPSSRDCSPETRSPCGLRGTSSSAGSFAMSLADPDRRPVLYPGTATVIYSAFDLPVRDGRLAMAQGDTLLVAGSYRDESLSAAGLWNSTVSLYQYAHPFALASGQLFSTLVLLYQPGTFTVANQTTGSRSRSSLRRWLQLGELRRQQPRVRLRRGPGARRSHPAVRWRPPDDPSCSPASAPDRSRADLRILLCQLRSSPVYPFFRRCVHHRRRSQPVHLHLSVLSLAALADLYLVALLAVAPFQPAVLRCLLPIFTVVFLADRCGVVRSVLLRSSLPPGATRSTLPPRLFGFRGPLPAPSSPPFPLPWTRSFFGRLLRLEHLPHPVVYTRS